MNKISGILHINELGEMKGEIPDDPIIEFCFLNAKAYCFNTVKKRRKEVKRNN